jgi:hypothetical protein
VDACKEKLITDKPKEPKNKMKVGNAKSKAEDLVERSAILG